MLPAFYRPLKLIMINQLNSNWVVNQATGINKVTEQKPAEPHAGSKPG